MQRTEPFGTREENRLRGHLAMGVRARFYGVPGSGADDAECLGDPGGLMLREVGKPELRIVECPGRGLGESLPLPG